MINLYNRKYKEKDLHNSRDTVQIYAIIINTVYQYIVYTMVRKAEVKDT